MNTVCFILKAPRVGTVKTRLAQSIGAERATAVYHALGKHQARALPASWKAVVHFSPAGAQKEMEQWLAGALPKGTRFEPQCDGDLGMRLSKVVKTELEKGASRLFLIGGDCPGITSSYLEEASQQLEHCDLVIGPAVDGGYVLLGLKFPHLELFSDIAWSTSSVLSQTLSVANRLGLHHHLLPSLEDIDDLDSLMRHTQIGSESFYAEQTQSTEYC